jgi:hypothetical protein
MNMRMRIKSVIEELSIKVPEIHNINGLSQAILDLFAIRLRRGILLNLSKNDSTGRMMFSLLKNQTVVPFITSDQPVINILGDYSDVIEPKELELYYPIKRRNIKENWSILRYIGKTTNSFTNGRYYYCPCSVDSTEFESIIDDEEFTSYLVNIGNNSKTYQSLEEAANDGVTQYVEQNSDWEIVEDPTVMMTEILNTNEML